MKYSGGRDLLFLENGFSRVESRNIVRKNDLSHAARKDPLFIEVKGNGNLRQRTYFPCYLLPLRQIGVHIRFPQLPRSWECGRESYRLWSEIWLRQVRR